VGCIGWRGYCIFVWGLFVGGVIVVFGVGIVGLFFFFFFRGFWLGRTFFSFFPLLKGGRGSKKLKINSKRGLTRSPRPSEEEKNCGWKGKRKGVRISSAEISQGGGGEALSPVMQEKCCCSVL